MAQYAPVLAPAKSITAVASADLTAGQLVGITGTDGTVPLVAPTPTHTGASVAKYLGVVATDTATGARVSVYTGGTQSLLASAGITAGAALAATTGGQAVTWNGTVSTEAIAVALTTVSGGSRVRAVMLR